MKKPEKQTEAESELFDIDPYLVSPVKAASYLSVSESFLAKKRMDGDPKLPFVKIGASVRYRVLDLREYADGNIRQSTIDGEATPSSAM